MLHLVPPVALFLAKHPAVDKFDLSSVKEAVVAAAPLKKDLSEELTNRLKMTFVRQGIGMLRISRIINIISKNQLY